MMGRAFQSAAMCLCLCPVVVRAWGDMLPRVEFILPKKLQGLLKPPARLKQAAPIFEILKRRPPLEEMKRPILQHLDRARVCCKAMSAQCIACSKGMRTEDLCQRVPHLPGCSAKGMAPKDLIKEAVMVAEGKRDATQVVEDLEQFVDKHPGAVERATTNALNGLSKIFSRSHKDETVQATAAPAGSLPAAVGQVGPAPIRSGPALFEPPVWAERGQRSRWVESPWVVAGITAATAAVCMGIAMGALCFAKINRVQIAREPLLGGGPLSGSLSDTTIAV